MSDGRTFNIGIIISTEPAITVALALDICLEHQILEYRPLATTDGKLVCFTTSNPTSVPKRLIEWASK